MPLRLDSESIREVTKLIKMNQKGRSDKVVKRYDEHADRAKRHVVELEVLDAIDSIMYHLQIRKKIALTRYDLDSLVKLFQDCEEAEKIVAKMLKILEPYTKDWDLGLNIFRKIEKHQQPWYMKNE